MNRRGFLKLLGIGSAVSLIPLGKVEALTHKLDGTLYEGGKAIAEVSNVTYDINVNGLAYTDVQVRDVIRQLVIKGSDG